jgi:hypothetical protein
MKKYKVILLIFVIMIVTLGLCFLFIKPKVFNFKNINEYVYFENHINEIDKIVLETYTLIGKNSYLIDKEKGKERQGDIQDKACEGAGLHLRHEKLFQEKDHILRRRHQLE